MSNMITCGKRLLMELAYKEYYNPEDMAVFLEENGLTFDSRYDKEFHEVNLLKTVIAILQSLSNNIDLYMKVEMNFGTRGEAFNSLRTRISDLKKRIADIEKESEDNDSFFFMFKS